MKDYLVFDLETQRSAQDVGGWGNIAEMKMSVGVVWDSKQQEYCIYYEEQVMDLIDHLLSGPLIIGYNHLGFDYTVLSGYFSAGKERNNMLSKLKNANNHDLLVDIKERIGKRIRLDAVARATLKIGKSADGLMALKWYKEYLNGEPEKLQLITNYCKQDVEVTRDVYLFGVQHKQIFYEDRIEGLKTLVVDWGVGIVSEVGENSVQLSF
ncbi:MAG: ribonuclease H-like domain-containing protein [SAR324 cluster bacterium]|nr:ribonuclease H-like domain-containing protein [SAR324 cluster bacterium]